MNEAPGLTTRWMRNAAAVLALVVLVFNGGAALAQSGDSNNAAVWYSRAFERVQGVSADEMTAVIDYASTGGKPSARVRGILRRMGPAIADLQRGAGRPYSDFNLDRDAGFSMMLPHLGQMRSLARLVQADAKMKLADGDAMGAATEIASLYRMADHASDDRILISSLVGAAIFSAADGLVTYGQDERAFGTSETSVLLQAVKGFDPRDPFSSVDAVVGEQVMGLQSMRDMLDPENPDGKRDLTDWFAVDDEGAGLLAGASRESIEAELDSYSRLMDRYVALFASDDPEAAMAELKELEKGIEAGEYGVIASVLAPALARCYEGLDKSRTMLHGRLDSLERLLAGEVDTIEFANAAVWYRRGIAELDALDADWRSQLAHFDPVKEQPINELIASMGDDRQGIVDAAIAQFVQGSLIRRCDFSRGRRDEEIVIPRYAGGMRDGLALLALDALRLDRLGQRDAAGQRLAVAFRMCGHLGSDGQVLSAIAAQDSFKILRDTGYILMPTDQRSSENRPVGGGMSAEQIAELASAVGRTSVADPFGFIAARVMISDDARERMQSALNYGVVSTARREAADSMDPVESNALALDWIGAQDCAGQWYLIAAIMFMGDVDGDIKERLAKTAGAFSAPDLGVIIDLAEVDAGVVLDRCVTGRWSDFHPPSIVGQLNIRQRTMRARADERVGARLAEAWAAMARPLREEATPTAVVEGDQ